MNNSNHGSQWSTALSDAVLAVSAFAASYNMFCMDNYNASGGFLMMTLAASIGALRFYCSCPSLGLVALHQYAAWSVKVLGLPLLAAGYLQSYYCTVSFIFSIIGALFFLLERTILNEDARNLVGDILGTLAVVTVFVYSVIIVNVFGIVGSMTVAVAGLFVRTEGEICGYLRVDIFHYLLAFSNFALMKGLAHFQLQPLYNNNPSA